jgi:hypothetical protein
MMQRRHFELIAEIIAKELEGEHREKAAYAFASVLPIANGRFDPQRFLEACKVKAFQGDKNGRFHMRDGTRNDSHAKEMETASQGSNQGQTRRGQLNSSRGPKQAR